MHASTSPAILQKKVCLLGAFGVGKTSLVRRFVESIFSDKYHTTIGVKIDKKKVHIEDHVIEMVLWDVAGKGPSQPIRNSYLGGMSGCFLVADGTRRATLDEALDIAKTAAVIATGTPIVFALNKSDLAVEWEIEPAWEQRLIRAGWPVIRTSAKTGEGVEHAFTLLGQQMTEK